MQTRPFGRTGLQLSVLGFGCGAVGGLMVRGTPADQERAIARALEAGVNYFDTAWQYGEGESEKNLGRILRTLRPANAVVGTNSGVCSLLRLPIAMRLTVGSSGRRWRGNSDDFHHGLLADQAEVSRRGAPV